MFYFEVLFVHLIYCISTAGRKQEKVRTIYEIISTNSLILSISSKDIKFLIACNYLFLT